MFNKLFGGWATFCHATKTKLKECCKNIRIHTPSLILTCFGCLIFISPKPLVVLALILTYNLLYFHEQLIVLTLLYYILLEQECQAIMLCKRLCIPHRAYFYSVVEQAWIPASLETNTEEFQVQVLPGLQTEFEAWSISQDHVSKMKNSVW